jgi:hypothetical protein
MHWLDAILLYLLFFLQGRLHLCMWSLLLILLLLLMLLLLLLAGGYTGC